MASTILSIGFAAWQASQAKSAAKKAAKEQKKALEALKGDPIATPEVEGEDLKKKFAKRKSRTQTIVTGDLAPTTVGKKTLLG